MPPPKEEPRLPGSTASLDPTIVAEPVPADPVRALAEMLSSALKQSQGPGPAVEKVKWQRRRVLLCLEDANLRERLRSALEPTRFEIFSADFAPEAIEILHESRAEVIVISPSFDPEHQGGSAMMHYIGSLTPQVRRRTYVILVSAQLRTLDNYLAFANNVNLTLHPEDIGAFQAIFDRSVRDFNELYRPWNLANSLAPF
jgi:PleD family two-component response regulator